MADEKSGETKLDPAEEKLREEGGPIIPGSEEFQDIPGAASESTPAGPSESLQTERINVQGITLEVPPPKHPGSASQEGEARTASPSFDVSKGLVRPEDSPLHGMGAEDVAYHRYTTGQVNLEVNLFNTVFRAVRNFVNQRLAQDPPDSAELGQSMFGPGQRTPLEQAEPYIAIEVYRQVRRSLRDDEDESRPGAWRRFWRWFMGRRREEDHGDEEPARMATPQPPRAPQQPDGS